MAVVRKMSDYEVGPDFCEKCEGIELIRFVKEWRPEQTSLVHGGKAPWYSESYLPSGAKTGR